MTTAYSTNLGLALPVEGELSGTWGDMVNNGITDYLDIAVAGTLTLNGDGAVTLTDTNGDSSSTNIGSTTAQYAALKITGTLTTTKVITAPSHSKTYIVDNSATGGTVTLKASGQTGISVAVGEICSAYFNGTDYVKVASTSTDGVATISFGSTGLTPSTATSGAVTVSGTLAVANGGTGITSFGTGVATALGQNVTGSGSIALSTSPSFTTPVLGTPTSGNLSNCTADGTNGVGYKNIPAVADKTTSYQIATTDVGKVVGVGTGGSITIPDSTFAAGDAVLIFNNTSGTVTITCSVTTAYIAGADADVASVTLATRGMCNILFISSTACVLTGNIE